MIRKAITSIKTQSYYTKIAKHTVLILVAMVLLGSLLHYMLTLRFEPLSGAISVEDIISEVLVVTLSLCFLGYLMVVHRVHRHLLVPLRRLIMRTKRFRKNLQQAKPDTEPFYDDSWEIQEIEELAQLERELKRLFSLSDKVQDTSERTSERSRALLNALGSPIVSVDKQMTIMFFNPAFASLFKSETFKAGHTGLQQLIRRPMVLERIQESIQAIEPLSVDFYLDKQKGSINERFYYNVSIAPISSQQTRVKGAICVFHDISSIKRLEKVRADFVSNVSHELRSPITSIHGYMQTLQSDLADTQDENIKGQLQVIGRNVDRLRFLVRDLLELSQLDTGVQLDIHQVHLNEFTNKVIQMYQPIVQETNKLINVQIDVESLPADGHRLEQVVINLIENAVKYSGEGQAINISWLSQNNHVVLSVKDQGPGIPAYHLPRLFERFYRVDESRSRKLGGTGLGLAIVKHIVQAHGGYVEVDSQVGQGTEFRCYFPV